MKKRTIPPTVAALMALVAAMVFVIGCGNRGEEGTEGSSVVTEAAVTGPIARGKASFEKYCANCHGKDAKGNGPLAELLKVPPADLTRLELKYGKYPVDLVYQTIDGREQTRGHGTREMPVWGNVWLDQSKGEDAEAEVAQQINEIVEYLRTLQGSEGG